MRRMLHLALLPPPSPLRCPSRPDQMLGPWDLLPADRPVLEIVDFYLDALLSEAGGLACCRDRGCRPDLSADPRPDRRIPTRPRCSATSESTRLEKQVELVDRLMAPPAYARYLQANELDAMMMAGTWGSLR